MKVLLSRVAARDLREIADYIANDSPLAAYNFTEFLRQKALGLGSFPYAFPLVPRYERYGLRRRPCGNYLIFYRVEKNTVLIARVLHAARDYEALLFPRG
ncbi:MAG: type II toxin-antitoxin system RelE/ParE family toxin [Rhodospirillales bacterium]